MSRRRRRTPVTLVLLHPMSFFQVLRRQPASLRLRCALRSYATDAPGAATPSAAKPTKQGPFSVTLQTFISFPSSLKHTSTRNPHPCLVMSCRHHYARHQLPERPGTGSRARRRGLPGMAVGRLERARIRGRRARRNERAQRKAEAQTAEHQGPEFHADAIEWAVGRLGAFCVSRDVAYL